MAGTPTPVNVDGRTDSEEERENEARATQEPTAAAVVGNGVGAHEEEKGPDCNRRRTHEGGPLLLPRVVAYERLSMAPLKRMTPRRIACVHGRLSLPIIRIAG
jgi:hypothetical protein